MHLDLYPAPITLDFPCPRCGAAAGETCRRKRLRDYDLLPHVPRQDRRTCAFNLLMLDKMSAKDNAYNEQQGDPHRNSTSRYFDYLIKVGGRLRVEVKEYSLTMPEGVASS